MDEEFFKQGKDRHNRNLKQLQPKYLHLMLVGEKTRPCAPTGLSIPRLVLNPKLSIFPMHKTTIYTEDLMGILTSNMDVNSFHNKIFVSKF